MNCVVQDPAYSRLKDRLIASTGLAFYADRDELLAELIGGRLSDLGLRDCSRYTRFLASGEKGSAEMDVLIAQLTIGETYFFRDEEVFAAIRDIILPDILERRQAQKQLRIWSAGCATGAEPYSLAIMLMDELDSPMAGWQVAIYATDLNRSYLAQAAEGKFRASALRSLSDEMKHECFLKQGQDWTIHPRYKQWISFHHMNLVESEFSTPWPDGTHFDLILCRNVMIYFASAVNRRLVGQLHRSLDYKGWLVVGAAEHNVENYQAFRTVNAPGTTLYQKKAVLARNSHTPPADVAQALVPAVSRLISTPVRRSEMVSKRNVGMSADAAGRSACATSLHRNTCEKSGFALEGLRQLVDRGTWQEAAEYSEGLLARDRLNPEIHFYRALIFENLGIVDQAERSLRHAIYLDRSFALAHYHLGLALKRIGRVRASARSFGNVLKVLSAAPDEAIVTAGPEVTAAGLKELAKMHLEESSGT